MLILKKVTNQINAKQHLADLPIITRKMSVWDYPIAPDNEGALIYTLFISDSFFLDTAQDVYSDEEKRMASDMAHCLAKAAIYSALTFLDKTDVRERGVPIYFTIQNTDYEELLPYFELAGVQKEFVIPFSPITYGHLKVLGVFFLPELKKYKRLFMVDPDIYIRTPHQKIPLVEKLFWDTTQYETAMTQGSWHHGPLIDPTRYNRCSELGGLERFPQISDTPPSELIKTLGEPPDVENDDTRRIFAVGCFQGFSDKFLTQVEEPYQKIAEFVKEVYDPNDKYAIVDEDVLHIFFNEFRTKVLDLKNDIPFHDYFVERHAPEYAHSVMNHIYDCDVGSAGAYNKWKDAWLTEAHETIDRIQRQ